MIREQLEQIERDTLCRFATLSSNSLGRVRPIEKCTVRTEFQRDRDRILHSKAFRRLKHKTQVFMAPQDDHYRTRLTHTLEVSQIARTISRSLRLNEDLTEAIALGHDLGHTPFGHACERSLNKLMPSGFAHNLHSLRVVDVLEKDYEGLNLTFEVRNGIACHTGNQIPKTLEGQVIRLSDRIAYINHDIDDAIRAKMLKPDSLPKECINVLGNTHGERINRMILDVVENSKDYSSIRMSDEVWQATDELRNFLFETVYLNPLAKSEENKAKDMLAFLFEYFVKHPDKMPELYVRNMGEESVERCVCDYISGMTDRYAIDLYSELFIPRVWRGRA